MKQSTGRSSKRVSRRVRNARKRVQMLAANAVRALEQQLGDVTLTKEKTLEMLTPDRHETSATLHATLPGLREDFACHSPEKLFAFDQIYAILIEDIDGYDDDDVAWMVEAVFSGAVPDSEVTRTRDLMRASNEARMVTAMSAKRLQEALFDVTVTKEQLQTMIDEHYRVRDKSDRMSKMLEELMRSFSTAHLGESVESTAAGSSSFV